MAHVRPFLPQDLLQRVQLLPNVLLFVLLQDTARLAVCLTDQGEHLPVDFTC